LAEETALIRAATKALERRDALGAQRHLKEHARRFEQPLLGFERQGLSMIADCQRGAPGARERAAAFVIRAEGSVLVGWLRRACGLGKLRD
jgi:hypothetical protein